MSYTAINIIAKAVQRLGSNAFMRRTATGGSTTTVIDTSLENLIVEEDVKYGLLYVTYDVGNAGAAPQGEYGEISAYNSSTYTFTIPTLTAAVASGDRFMVIMPKYPQELLLSLLNETLVDLGPIAIVDKTTLDSDSSVLEYSLPTAFDTKPPTAIYLQRSTSTNANDWIAVLGWRVEPAAVGTRTKLIVPDYLDDGYDICIIYEDTHTNCGLLSDTISGTIPEKLLELKLAEKILDWEGVNDSNINRANKLQSELAKAERDFPIWTPAVIPDMLDFSR